jgi:fatty acid amide hydrolase 2
MTWSSDFKLRALRLLRRFIDLFAGYLFWLVYRGSRPVVPPIRNLLLMESATALAFKIRTRKASITHLRVFFI